MMYVKEKVRKSERKNHEREKQDILVARPVPSN